MGDRKKRGESKDGKKRVGKREDHTPYTDSPASPFD